MKIGTRNVRSLCRIGSLKTVASELEFISDKVAVKEVSCDRE
jgi:hypothetical protein